MHFPEIREIETEMQEVNRPRIKDMCEYHNQMGSTLHETKENINNLKESFQL